MVVDPCGRIESVGDSVPGGANHDLPLLRGSGVLEQLAEGEAAMVDKGYVGVKNYYPDMPVVIPFKARRNHPLTEEQKAYNRGVVRYRIVVEHTMAQLNRFTVLRQVFRGQQARQAQSDGPCGGEVGEPSAAGQAAEDLRRVRAAPNQGRNGPGELRYNPIQERGRNGLHLEDVYRRLFNPDLDLRAYGLMLRNAEALTKGITDDIVDGMSLGKIKTLIEEIRYERYRWTPVRRILIPKANGKMRPLCIPSWTDKLLQETMRSILEAYYCRSSATTPTAFDPDWDVTPHCRTSPSTGRARSGSSRVIKKIISTSSLGPAVDPWREDRRQPLPQARHYRLKAGYLRCGTLNPR